MSNVAKSIFRSRPKNRIPQEPLKLRHYIRANGTMNSSDVSHARHRERSDLRVKFLP